jgi:hypothetical protein
MSVRRIAVMSASDRTVVLENASLILVVIYTCQFNRYQEDYASGLQDCLPV